MKKGAIALAVAVFLWQVYRSAITAATPTEAVMYTKFASRPFATVMASPFDPANQVLHTLLVGRLVRIFGLTEFTMRLSSLLGFVVYLGAFFRLACRQKWGWLAYTFCVANLFTLGWLPTSSGMWMAAGLFLFGLRNLAKRDYKRAALQCGIAIGFDLAFLIPVVLTALAFLAFHQGVKEIGYYLVSISLIAGSLWGLTGLRTSPSTWQMATELWPHFLVVIPVLVAYTLLRVSGWQPIGVCATALIAIAGAFLALGPKSPSFSKGPESGLPRASRALRDDIRRHEFRIVGVAVSGEIQRPFEFYQRRYALGATQSVADWGVADYWLALDSDRRFASHLGATRIFQRDGISVFRRD